MIRATATYTPRMDAGRFIESIVRPAARAGVQVAARHTLDAAKGLVPVDTGALKASGYTEVRDTPKTVVGVIGFSESYAAYVEYGTGRAGAASAGRGPYPYSMAWPGMVAQPYLRPAIDITRGDVGTIVARELALRMRK